MPLTTRQRDRAPARNPRRFAETGPDRAMSTATLRVLAAAVVIAAAPGTGLADDWPEYRGAGRQGIWTETGILDTFPAAGLSYSWRVPIHDGHAGPAVAGGRVFVLDARPAEGERPGMRRIERILCLDEETGAVLWSHEWAADYAGLQPLYAIGPRATPTVDGDRVYVQGAMGRLLALDVATGEVQWSKDYVADFGAEVPAWGMASAFFVRNGDRYFITNDRGELIIARLSPAGVDVISRTHLLEPTHPVPRRRELGTVLWSYPAYANRHIVARNGREIVRASLAAPGYRD